MRPFISRGLNGLFSVQVHMHHKSFYYRQKSYVFLIRKSQVSDKLLLQTELSHNERRVMSKKDVSKDLGTMSKKAEEQSLSKKQSKTQDKVSSENDSQESKIPLEEMSSRQIGEKGEEIAAKYLIKRGYKIIQTNWTCQIGEVDIVAQDGNNVVLVEVKTRRILNKDDSIMPELAVNRAKQEKYRTLALMYTALHPALTSIRFDVVAINLVAPSTASLRHLIGAFSWDEQ